MTGGFGVWFFKALGGFKFDGMRGILEVAPELIKGVDRVLCERSIHGQRLASRIRRLGGTTLYDVEIPWNTPAEIRIPVGNGKTLVNGRGLSDGAANYSLEQGVLTIKTCGGYWSVSVEASDEA